MRGYEYEKGRFVVIDDDEFGKLPVKSARYIQIVDFINIAEIDPAYYEKTYYLQPDANSEKAYLLLRGALLKTKKAAAAKIKLRQKERLCVVSCLDKALCIQTMFFADEIRGTEEIGVENIEKKAELFRAGRDMAAQPIENLSARFKYDKYHDEYRQEFLKLIKAKTEEREIIESARIETTMPNNIDLMQRLKKSVETTKLRKAY